MGVNCFAAQRSFCGNGRLEITEQCDDGNYHSWDGCDSNCHIEAGFLCENVTVTGVSGSTTVFLITQCCAALYNPVTNRTVCSCEGQASDSELYYINKHCQKVDIDECLHNNGECAVNAICINFNSTHQTSEPGTGLGRQCICPEGLYGDGIQRCDSIRYTVAVSLSIRNKTTAGNYISISWILQHLQGFNFENDTDILAISAAYLPHARHLLQSEYSHFTIVLDVSTWDAMQALVADVNAQMLADFLSNASNGLNEITVLQEAVTVVEQSPKSYNFVQDSAPGFLVTNVAQRAFFEDPETVQQSYAWDITVHIFAPRDVIAVLFATKRHAGHATTRHECVESTDICCLHRMQQDHFMGDFALFVQANISLFCDETSGYPNATAQLMPSSLFFPDNLQRVWWKGHFDFSNRSDTLVLPTSHVPTDLMLRLTQHDIATELSSALVYANGSVYTFAIGMLFIHPLSAPYLYTAVAQAQIQLFVSDTATFVSTAHQAYSFLESLDMTLYEIDYRPVLQELYQLPFVRVVFVIPEYITDAQVRSDSIQFTLAGDITQITAWSNPCFSSMNVSARDNSGLWDSEEGVKLLYTAAMAQECALRDMNLCESNMLAPNVYAIDIPISNNEVPSVLDALQTSQSSADTYLFLRMVLTGTQNNTGELTQALTQVNAQLLVHASTTMKLCADVISSLLSETEFTSITVAIGVRQQAIYNDVRDAIVFTDVKNSIQYEKLKALDTSAAFKAVSVIDSIMTLVIQGQEAYFEQSEHLAYLVTYDHVITMHIRNDEKYYAMRNLLGNGSAYSVNRNQQGVYSITLSDESLRTCYGEAMIPNTKPDKNLDCVVQHPVANRIVYSEQARLVTSHIEADIAWFLAQFGDTPFMHTTASRFALSTKTRFGLNFRYKQALWLTPTYEWPSLTTIDTEDRTIVMLAYTVQT